MRVAPQWPVRVLAGAAAVLLTVSGAAGQPAPSPAASAPAIKPPAAAKPTPQRSGPASAKGWNELTAAQQQALKPLAASWNGIDEAQKRKWLALSQNFNTLSLAEQAKLHSRMTEWAALSPKQRTEARLNFAESKTVPADEKLSKWQSYQALSPEEKSKLAASASARPPGAATAVKTVPSQKPAAPVPVKPAETAASGARAAASTPRQVDQKTLLPRTSGNRP